MRRYLLITFLLLFACTGGYAQSLSFEELKDLTNLNNDQAHNYLIVSKGFKKKGKHIYDGRDFEIFKSNRTDPAKAETVSLRSSEVTSGEVSRQVIYYTLRLQDINALLAQAKKSDMDMVFKGSDKYNNIYRFDNSLFMAIISISLDKRSGTIRVEEK
ncbi:MAG: hypothetical protein JWQ66_3533 [Mucilaginibacter sp.]|nr:hypothetical protein [Mucilaginibacter sp.]